MNTKMYVGNLPFSTTEEEIRTLFSSYGDVTEIFLPLDQETGRLRGFAFVTMDSPESMQKAIAGVDGMQVNGRAVAVNEARPKEAPLGDSYSRGGDRGRGEKSFRPAARSSRW